MPSVTAIRRTKAGVEISGVPEPEPAAGEVLIRPTLLGVSPADVRAAMGEPAHFGVLGHQFVGVVERVNEASDEWLGKRVVGDINIVPRSAPLARVGLGAHAPERSVLGLHKRDGCFAERFTLPASNLTAVPDGVGDEEAVFAVPLAAAVHASQIVRLESKAFVTVIGDTLQALLCAQVMTRLNATVRLLGRRRERFELCDKWGVKHRAIGEAGLRADQDVVIECTGSAEGVEMAFGLVRPRGSVVLRTEPMPLPGMVVGGGGGPDLTAAILNEIEMVGSRDGRVREAIDLMAAGDVSLSGLVSARCALADGVSALERVSTGEPLKVLLTV